MRRKRKARPRRLWLKSESSLTMSTAGNKVLAITPLYQKLEIFAPVVATWAGVRGNITWVAVNDHSPAATLELARHRMQLIVGSGELEHPGYVRTDAGHNWELKSMDRMARIRTRMLRLALDVQREFANGGKYDYLLLVDSDVALAPSVVERLIESFNRGDMAGKPPNKTTDEEFPREVFAPGTGPDPLTLAISPIYWTRWDTTGPEYPQVWDYHPYSFEGVTGERMRQLRTPGLHKVRGLGAVTMIDMGWLESRGTETLNFLPIESLAKATGPGGMMRGEDRAFCIRAECAGMSLYGLAANPSLAFHVYRAADVHGIAGWLERHRAEVNVP